jgi:deazaflavin-dependent oxidoreductase (nitroreductase family)
MLIWRVVNPAARSLAGIAPWWVVLETTGRRSGQLRRTPLARGPVEDGSLWLIAVHGAHSSWVANVRANPAVRVRLKGRWLEGRATAQPFDPKRADRFNRYARSAPGTVGIDPLLVQVELLS